MLSSFAFDEMDITIWTLVAISLSRMRVNITNRSSRQLGFDHVRGLNVDLIEHNDPFPVTINELIFSAYAMDGDRVSANEHGRVPTGLRRREKARPSARRRRSTAMNQSSTLSRMLNSVSITGM